MGTGAWLLKGLVLALMAVDLVIISFIIYFAYA